MSNTALIHGPLPETNYLYKNVVVKGNFPLASLLVHPDTKYTIKHNFDLEGQTIELPPNCILAIDGGMIYNGTLVGDDSILIDVNRLGNVLDNVIQTGTWKKQDVLNSLSIGTVISGDEPQVTITGEDGDAILNFVLPKGDKGETGTQGELGIQGLLGIHGEKGDKGTSITSFTKNSEETEDYLGYNVEFDDGSILSVNIPKGPKGDQGILGIQGIQGILGVPGPTGPLGPKGDTVTATDYTLYNVQGSSSEGAMSQDATTKAISAQTGYYICSTEAANPSKKATAENGNLYKLVKGGHFKVYMEFANTADSYVTLLVGSETAVDLYYNGAAVSAQNTWEANEIISVFYDGTRFMASNAQGGGGKAEKIKYDNSQSGLAEENVQGALDEVKLDIGDLYDETYINTPLLDGYYSISNGKIILNQVSGNFSYVAPIDVTGYDRMRLLFYLSPIYDASTAFVDDSDNVIGGTIETLGEYIIVKVPEGATKLCISTRTASSTTIYAYGIKDKSVESKITQVNDEIGEDYNSTNAYFNIEPTTYFTYTDGSVNTLTNTNFNGAVIDLDTRYQYIELKYQTWPNNAGRTFFVDSDGHKVGDCLTQRGESWQKVEIPENAARLYVSSYKYGVALRYYQKKVISQRITNIERNIGVMDTYEDIDIPFSFKTYYTYDNGPVINSHNNFTGAVIDIGNYNYLILRFRNPSYNAAWSFFTDDNGQMKGERITSEGAQFKIAVPNGATKLYISGFKSTIYAVGIKGDGNTLTERLDNIESTISIGPSEFLQNLQWDYFFDANAQSGYYITRINKKKLYGTSQYPFVWYTPTRLTAQEVAASAGFFFIMNCATSPFETVEGQVIVNREVINNTPHTHHVGAMPLTINSSGDLGYAAADADAYELVNNGIVSACVGFCPIVDNYLPLEPPIIADTDHFTQRRQRQVIGQYGNGDYCVITCEGASAGGDKFDNSRGFTLAETRAICISNNLKFAYFCDGGGSTETVIMKKQLNSVYEGTTGRTRDVFIVFNGSTVYTPNQE